MKTDVDYKQTLTIKSYFLWLKKTLSRALRLPYAPKYFRTRQIYLLANIQRSSKDTTRLHL